MAGYQVYEHNHRGQYGCSTGYPPVSAEVQARYRSAWPSAEAAAGVSTVSSV